MAEKQTDRESRKRKLLLAMWVLALGGLAVAVYLTWVYYSAFASSSYHPGCDINSSWSCTAVAGSEYALILGVPNALYGAVVYLLVLIFIPLRLKTKIRAFAHLENYLVLLALFDLAISGYLAYASFFILHKECIYCMTLYGVNVAFLIAALLAVEWKALGGQMRDDLVLLQTDPKVLGPVLIAVIAAGVFAVIQYSRGKGRERIPPIPGRSGVVLDLRGDPTLGSARAPITIIEFSDFQCPYCREMHFLLKRLRAKHPGQIRLVFKNFPLDSECNPRLEYPAHPHSCMAAVAAECAYQLGAFEKFYDRLMTASNYRPESLAAMALDSGLEVNGFQQCLLSGRAREEIRRDIADALKLDIQGTPLFVINGNLFSGSFSEQQMEILVKEILAGKDITVPAQ